MSAKTAFNTQLKATISSTLTKIKDVTSLKPFGLKANTVDSSSHDSPATSGGKGIVEKITGMVEMGGVSFDVNYDPTDTTHQFLESHIGEAVVFNIVFPGTTTRTAAFTAIITGFAPDAPHNGKYTASGTLEITGAITWS